LQFVKPALLCAVLFLAACAVQPPPPVAEVPRGSGQIRGIDLPTDASDVLGELRRIPLDFVARYYRDPASRWPTLSAAEVQRLSGLGYKIVTVWEWHSGDPAYFSYASGYYDALSAARQAKEVGQPPGSAIYFAVDFNARDVALQRVDQYFRGVNAGLAAAGSGRPEYRVGVYGSGAVCGLIKGERLAQYTWLSGSTAWDGTSGYADWNIRQAAQGARFGNLAFNHDANEARDDYGAFQPGNYANAATPAGAVVTAVAAAPAAAAALVGGAVAAVVPAAAETAAAPPAIAAPAATVAAPAATPAPAIAAAPPQTVAPVAAIAPAAPHPLPPGSAAADVAAEAAAEPPAAAPPARTHAHTAGRPVVPKRQPAVVAVSHRAVAASSRHADGASSAEARRPEHRVSLSRRTEARGTPARPGKPEAAHAAERHGGERRHPAHSAGASDG